MAIDIRAVVTCGLGPVISASVTDDYLQGSGVIKTRGTVELAGIFTPAVGTTVTFGYDGPAGTASVPRQLRVLSCMANPYKQTTAVELGCALTYFANRKPPTVNPNTKDPDANGDVPCYVFSFATLPISASYVLQFCADKLGLVLSSNPLTNQFSIDEFDLSPGYVQVISDLLVSEGYFGMVRSGNTLQITSFEGGSTTGPLITDADVIDLGPVGVGNLPGESVRVSYTTLRFKKPDNNGIASGSGSGGRNWEFSETFGPQSPVSVTYQDGDGVTQTVTGTFATYSSSFSRYDVKDRLVETVTISSASSAQVNAQWASDVASVGGNWNVPVYTFTHMQPTYGRSYESAPLGTSTTLFQAAQTKTSEEIKQEMADRILADTGPASECIIRSAPEQIDFVVVSQTTKTYVSQMQVAGSINGARFKADDGGTYSLSTGATIMQSSETVEYDKDPGTGITRTVTSRYMIGAGTIGGQQSLAEAAQIVVDTTTLGSLTTSMDLLLSKATEVHFAGAETQIRTEREFGLQKRPPQSERNNAANAQADKLEQISETQWAVGSAETTATVELSLPYAPDDVISWDGSEFDVVPSDAQEKAAAFGRIQNRLLLGNRNALSLQLPPSRMPDEPFAPIYVQAAGITGQYRLNGCSWAMTGDGVIASTDALFWGAVGADEGAGNAFFPLPPGMTTADLPANPAPD